MPSSVEPTQSHDASAEAARMRDTLRQIFHDSLAECSVESAFARNVNYDHGILRICDDLYNLDSYSRVIAISIGKAGHTMAEALSSQLGSRAMGIVASPVDPPFQQPGFAYYRGGHPLPNAESVHAASQILRAVRGLDENTLVLFLISGGGSAVVEQPLYDSISLEDLVETYKLLVHSGAPISQINAIRKHLSAIKGGRLARAASPAHQVSILISDVPENALDSLASGPTMADKSTAAECYSIAAQYELTSRFPESVRTVFMQRALEETPKADDAAFVHSRWWPLLSSSTIANAAGTRAAAAGLAVEIDSSCDDWDYQRAADYLLDRVRQLRKGACRVCVISAGEVTVKVTGDAGAGGRNQQFALYCATKIAGENIAVLSAGTDGIDGNSEAAGAVVDGTTIERARDAGLDPQTALAKFDAFPLLNKLGDAIVTGPTGNNLRDLRILVAY